MPLISDLKSLNGGSFDYCIVGTGPAGITLASQLASTGRKILLIEAGGAEHDAEGSRLFTIEEKSDVSPTAIHRLRCFGGTSGHWAGWCAPLDRQDLVASWSELSGWPLKFSELTDWYPMADAILGLVKQVPDEQDQPRTPTELSGLKYINWRFSHPPVRFGATYRAALEAKPNVHLALACPLKHIEMDPDSSKIRKLHFGNSLSTISIEASCYVLAAGGIETARLILNSAARSKRKIGEGSAFLGRCFMDHPHFYEAGKIIHWAGPLPLNVANEDKCEERLKTPFLQIAPEVRAAKRWNNLVIRLRKIANPSPEDERLRLFMETVYGRPTIISNVTLMCEQEPSLDNRLELTPELDESGTHKVKLTSALHDIDWTTYTESIRYLSLYFSKNNLGRININPNLLNRSSTPTCGPHHMGTTRMARTPKHGYVDENCQVFGVSNLWIAGGSLFPRSSCVNPTLTIVALALRLANFLSRNVSRAP
jgi:choline dehydrogenase-like flavoprotein